MSCFNVFYHQQAHVQDEIILSSSPKNKPYQVSSEYHNQPSPKLSHTGNGYSRTEQSTDQREKNEGQGHQ